MREILEQMLYDNKRLADLTNKELSKLSKADTKGVSTKAQVLINAELTKRIK